MLKAQPFIDPYANRDDAQVQPFSRQSLVIDYPNAGLEQRYLRACWRDSFNARLPNPVITRIAATYFDPLVHGGSVRKNRPITGLHTNSLPKVTRVRTQAYPHDLHGAGGPRRKYDNAHARPNRQLSPPTSASWLHERLSAQLRAKRGSRAVLNSAIAELADDVRDGTGGLVRGVRLTLNGRLGKQKKGMAQTLSRSIGRVPLSSLHNKVELAQGFVTTSLGCIGLKVWVCYA